MQYFLCILYVGTFLHQPIIHQLVALLQIILFWHMIFTSAVELPC